MHTHSSIARTYMSFWKNPAQPWVDPSRPSWSLRPTPESVPILPESFRHRSQPRPPGPQPITAPSCCHGMSWPRDGKGRDFFTRSRKGRGHQNRASGGHQIIRYHRHFGPGFRGQHGMILQKHPMHGISQLHAQALYKQFYEHIINVRPASSAKNECLLNRRHLFGVGIDWSTLTDHLLCQ